MSEELFTLCDGCHRHPKNFESMAKDMPSTEAVMQIAEIFKLLSDYTRAMILCSLAGGEMCVCDIAQAVGASQSAVSHQLRFLRAARLVKFRKDGKNAFYSLDDGHIEGLLNMALEHVSEHSGKRGE